MSNNPSTNVKVVNSQTDKKQPSKAVPTGNSSYVKWMTEYQGFLTLTLIVVTAYLGWANLVEQKKNNDLQEAIYSPSFIPTEYIPPQEINGEYESTFRVSNHGYVGGSYGVVIKSDTFYLTRRERVNERSISWGYHVPQNEGSVQEFTITAPAKNIPLHASYHIELTADGYGSKEYHFCYQNIGGKKYKRTVCK